MNRPAGSPVNQRTHPMIRKAFVMSLNAGCEAEYEQRHNPIWPELERTLLEHGVTNYSIFLPGCRHRGRRHRPLSPTRRVRSDGPR